MFGRDWRLSEREYDVVVERDVPIPVDDGIDLVGDVFRPDADGEYPVILSASPYNVEFQSARITPRASTSGNAWIEAGDPYFFARRGYGHAIINVRGTGKSGGRFRNLGPREVTDVVEAVEWLAERPWSSGAVGMLGISYFGMIQPFVAEREPPHLEAIFAPWAATDLYRDWHYHGGIFHHGMGYKWSQQLDNLRPYSWSRENLSEEEFDRRVETALADEEIRAVSVYVEALENPDEGVNPYLVDIAINRLDEAGGYWEERRVPYENTSIPAYHGADWGHYRIHLEAGFRNFVNWDGPKKLLVGPPEFADRPFYQLQYESLRWFDHWLAGNDTGMMDEPAVRLFVMGRGAWKEAEEWPLPETKWTPFYLHENGVMDEKEHLAGEGYSTYDDSPFGRGRQTYWTPRLVERTELLGTVPVHLYASTTADDVLFFLTLLKRGADTDDGVEELTWGWLRGSHRGEDPDASEPWSIHHPHDYPEPVVPNEVTEFRVNVRPVGAVFRPGDRVGLRIGSADVGTVDASGIPHEKIRATYAAGRHLSRQSSSRVTIYHDEERPSAALLPVTDGNVMGTFRSGGQPVAFDERVPYEKIWADERGSLEE